MNRLARLAVQVVLGALGVIVLGLVLGWVFRLGPFRPGPSPAVKVQAQVEKAVPKTQGQASEAVAKVETEGRAAIASTDRRTEQHVAKVRAAQPVAPRPAPGAPRVQYLDYPDGQFYGGVCDSRLYKGNPDCGGVGRQPEGRDPRARPGALRGR